MKTKLVQDFHAEAEARLGELDQGHPAPQTIMLDIPATAEERTARTKLFNEVRQCMDAVVDAAVSWHQSGQEGDGTWFDKGEVLGRSIDRLLALRDTPSAAPLPAPVSTESSGQPESGWLMERNHTPEGPEYLTIEGGAFGWTTDNLKALRLARREDADMLADIIEDCWHVREHQWG